ncbi:hypothetical protein ES288_D13G185700v1 [Gossypium darwinii]|uniref:Uncharacterized protein n=1 Tax=Gossypium darwinii TaxID=34276 RepID=A0A5D1ZZF3_GOSDA|nr:hypothetical protein ES288_D13G185700v1 [Gossypium darwinii]
MERSKSFEGKIKKFGSLVSPFSTITRKPNRYSVVCEAAPKKKADSAAKRDRQAKKRQIYNKAKKFQVKTRMKKVLEALDVLRKKPEAQAKEIYQLRN